MKMTGKVEASFKAHRVCEDLLSILKSSKLNYLVKETPYSAFVTIRKRFVKDSDISDVTIVPRDDVDCDLKRENHILKEKCKSLEIDIGFLTIEKETLEVACAKLKRKC